MHFSCQKREKKEKIQTINHRQQSNHYLSTQVIQCGRRHSCTSSEEADSQI
jgi:hypothetical protein